MRSASEPTQGTILDMDSNVSEEDLRQISERLRDIARYVRGNGGEPELRGAAVDALIAASNSCDRRYLKELLSGLVTACEAIADLAPAI